MSDRNSNAQVEYRPIEGFPGYRVGDDGTVWTCLVRNGYGTWVVGPEWTVKKTGVVSCGYVGATLYCDGKSRSKLVHRLVLEAFVGPCPKGQQACHSPDPTKTNNRLSNLRWASAKDNASDRDVCGTTARGERNGEAKLREADVIEIRRLLVEGELQKTLATKYGVHKSMISLIARRKKWAYLA